MNYKTVYNINNKRFVPFYVIPFPFLLIATSLFCISVFTNAFTRLWQFSFGMFAVSFLVWSLISLFQMIADEHYIFKPYRENTCEVVEGIVSGFHEHSRISAVEEFFVSGLRFVIPNASSRVGYHKFKRKGGVITHDGQNVRITYAYNKMLGNDYVIVKIEIAQE